MSAWYLSYSVRASQRLRRRPPQVNSGVRQLSLRPHMKLRHLARFVAALSLPLGLGCRADPADDRFARSVLEKLRAGDSTAVALLQPNTPISQEGWASIRPVAEGLSRFDTDSLALVEWESGTDAQGKYRKLTYRVGSGARARHVEVWLVSGSSKTYVNTIRIAPLHSVTGAGS